MGLSFNRSGKATQARRRFLKRRRGLATYEAMVLAAVIAASLVGGGWFWYAQSASVKASEHRVLTSNIDRVARAADEWIVKFGASASGRSIDLSRFCPWANAKFADTDELTLRTLAFSNNSNVTAITPQAKPSKADTSFDSQYPPDGIAWSLLPQPRVGARAHCPSAATEQQVGGGSTPNAGEVGAAASHDIIVSGKGSLKIGSSPISGAPGFDANSASVPAGTTALQAVGLASTRGIWMAQFRWNPKVGATSCTDPTGNTDDMDVIPQAGQGAVPLSSPPVGMTPLPAGTKGCLGSDNHALVFGGTAPDGASYCLIKVFKADNKRDIGEYRFARLPSKTQGGADGFAICSLGVHVQGKHAAKHNAGWPAAT